MHTLAYALTSYGLWILAPILYRVISKVFKTL